MLKTGCLLIGILICFTNGAFAQRILPGFRGWIYSSPPPNQTFGTSTSLETNFNRAKLNWYVIDPAFYFGNIPTIFPESDLSNHYTREVTPSEVFPNGTNIVGDNILSTFDLQFTPDQPGPYNFDVLPSNTSAGINSEGKLLAPETRWAGIMRRFMDPDLPAQGIDSIDFWLLDPFVYNSGHSGLTLTFQFGEVSEDALVDNVLNFEHGLSGYLNSTEWGWYPLQLIGFSEFTADDALRRRLDIGLDGMSDENERLWFETAYLDPIKTAFGQNSQAFLQAWEDPSKDNFIHFNAPSMDNVSISDRYAGCNGMEGNSAILEPIDGYISYTSHPDMEDLNRDQTLNVVESTEDYVLRLEPGMVDAASYIVDSVQAEVDLINYNTETVTWYHFRLPLVKAGSNLSLDDFRNISSLRLVLSDCAEPVTLRFAQSEILNNYNPGASLFDFERPKAIPFPNPFDQSLQFELDNNNEWPSRLQLWDTNGRAVEEYTNYQLDSRYFPDSKLSPGVYFYKLYTVNSIDGKTATYFGKVVKTR